MPEPQVATGLLPAAGNLTVREIGLDRPWIWLQAGWNDLRACGWRSLGFGLVFALGGFVVSYALVRSGLWYLVLPMTCGFLIMGPIAAVAVYDLSRRRAMGMPPALDVGAFLANGIQIALMGVALLIFFLAWVRFAALLFMLFFGLEPPPLDRFFAATFLAPENIAFVVTGFAIGGVLAALAFSISVVAIPLLLDRPQANVVTAIATSLEAVRRNPLPMALWAALITLFVGAGIATFYVGLIVTLPLIAHASWHAYRDLVDRH